MVHEGRGHCALRRRGGGAWLRHDSVRRLPRVVGILLDRLDRLDRLHRVRRGHVAAALHEHVPVRVSRHAGCIRCRVNLAELSRRDHVVPRHH